MDEDFDYGIDFDGPWPCLEYGHFDCADREYGPCRAEYYAQLMAEDQDLTALL
jgi:hypothetical protein